MAQCRIGAGWSRISERFQDSDAAAHITGLAVARLLHAQVLAKQIGAKLVPMGSAGAKAMAVVLGEADIYAHSGGQFEWDSAAPVAVAQAAGRHVSRLDGSPLVYSQPHPWLPDLLICRPDLAATVIEICSSIS
jgi:3'-phosphoadenosine 5'-phosphosulfate (PAPS) 3'-phosphatase